MLDYRAWADAVLIQVCYRVSKSNQMWAKTKPLDNALVNVTLRKGTGSSLFLSRSKVRLNGSDHDQRGQSECRGETRWTARLRPALDFGEKLMKGRSGEVRRGVFNTTRPPIERPLELGSNPDEMSTRVTP